MPALLELQRAFGAALLGAALPEAADLDPSLVGLDPLLLGIYRNTCHSTLTAALALSYPAVQRLVGAEFFEAAAQQFFAAHPPRNACLNDFGLGFPDFLLGHPQASALRYLPDVARLEWAVNRALHAADVPGLEPASLRGLDPSRIPELRFTLHPAVTVLELQTPADTIWRAVLDEDDAALQALDPTAGPVWLLIDRGPEGLRVRRMANGAARFTQRLCAGDSLQAALVAPDLEAVLADHLASGRLIAWRIPNANADSQETGDEY